MPPLAPTHIDVHIAPLRRDSQRTQAPKVKFSLNRPPRQPGGGAKAPYERLDRHLSLETRECAAQTDMGVAAKRYVAIALRCMSNTSGFSKCCGLRCAAPMTIVIDDPAGTCAPSISRSQEAERPKPARAFEPQGLLHHRGNQLQIWPAPPATRRGASTVCKSRFRLGSAWFVAGHEK